MTDSSNSYFSPHQRDSPSEHAMFIGGGTTDSASSPSRNSSPDVILAVPNPDTRRVDKENQTEVSAEPNTGGGRPVSQPSLRAEGLNDDHPSTDPATRGKNPDNAMEPGAPGPELVGGSERVLRPVPSPSPAGPEGRDNGTNQPE